MSLYAFTTHRFTNADKTGSSGPTLKQVRDKYSVTWANTYLNMNNDDGIQRWTVPATGNYTIRVVGATGSNEKETTVQVGNPADMTGTFSLTQGEIIKILVGQTGWLGSVRPGWGGGGGTFVAKSDDTPLIVAGGCGSGHTGQTTSGTRQNANTGTSGMLESGTSGTWTTASNGGDGAGFNTNGTIGNGVVYDLGVSAVAGKSFKNGGVGGNVGGGFGGGGNVTNTYGGGGGGYNGGQGAIASPHNGGGGGSYNSGTNQTNTLYTNAMTTMSHGFVVITTSQITATLTVSQLIFYRKFVSGASISFDVVSSNAGSVSRTHESNDNAIVTIPSSGSPSATIAGPGKTTIKVTQPATGNYTQVTENALITIIVVGQGKTYTSETFPASFDLSGTNLTGSVFNSCNLTSANLVGATVNALTDFSTSTLTNIISGRINGITSRLPVGFTMI